MPGCRSPEKTPDVVPKRLPDECEQLARVICAGIASSSAAAEVLQAARAVAWRVYCAGWAAGHRGEGRLS